MTHKKIVGTTILMALGWTVFVLGLVGLILEPLVGALLAITGAILIIGGMITEAINRKQNAFEELQNSREESITAID